MEDDEISLDDELEPADGRERRSAWSRVAFGVAVLGIVITALIWNQTPVPTAPPSRAIGSHLLSPIAFRVPDGAATTSDSSYLGIRFRTGAALLVTAPTQVLTTSGTRAPLPADPAGWLRSHPSVLVSRVRTVDIDGLRATQLDYRRSDLAQPRSTFSGTSLFCAPVPCTRITPAARVRATFLQLDGRLVLVEAVWRADEENSGSHLPGYLATSYRALLDELARTGNPSADAHP